MCAANWRGSVIGVRLSPFVTITRLSCWSRATGLGMRVKGEKLLLAGGSPRGTLYAVSRFLQEQCGVRWWTPWATNMPARKTLEIRELDVREKPAFEYRAPFWFAGFEPTWKVHNC